MVSVTSNGQEIAGGFQKLEQRARALVFDFVIENMNSGICPDVSRRLIRSAVLSTAALTEFVKTGGGFDGDNEGE